MVDPAASALNEPRREPGPPRILLVEDHEDSAAVFERLLVRRGFQVLRAATLKEGLAHLDGSDVDLVIADLSLPDGSGLDLMHGLTSRRVPAIALSGHAAPEDERRSLEAGFSRHLVKPVDFPALHAAIQDLLRRT